MIKKSLQVFGLLIFSWAHFAALGEALPEVSVSEFEDTTHLELSGLKSWNYEIVKPTDQVLVLEVPRISPESQKLLKAYKDRYIESVAIESAGLQSKITFRLKEAHIEHFDYMTDEPSLLIVDFYQKTKSEAKVKKTASAKKSSSKRSSRKDNAESVDPSRSPASSELLIVEKEDPQVSLERRFGAFDSSDEDFGRFQIKDYEINESSIIASKQDIYLKYPPLIMPVSRLDHWISVQPEYVIKPKDSKETKEAELLYTLYIRGRENVFLKTLNYFSKQYPDSEYSEILDNLAADIYLKRWRKSDNAKDYELAKDKLSDLVERHNESPLTRRNQFLLAYATLERGEALPTLEIVQKLLRLYPDSEEAPHLKLAQAEALMKLKKFEEARAVYEEMIKDYPNTLFAAQAEYRKGDVAMRSGNWSQAQTEYKKAVENLKKYEGAYPNAHFNRGEALFWMGQYKESVAELAEFLKLFPTHSYGAYAMTRIGNLFDILGANQKRVVGAYLESYFRYPNEPGAKIARIRLLSQKMKSMKEKAFEKALEEIAALQKELKLSDVNEFVTLLIADGHEARGDFDTSLKILSTFYQKHPMSAHRETIQRQVRRNIANEMKRRVDNNNYLGALEFYQDYSRTWLQDSKRIDIDYFRAKAYELAGVYDEAQKIYTSVVTRLEQMAGTQEEKERRVHESLPSKDQVYLRLAKVMNEQREFVRSYKTLKKIVEPKELLPEEKIERTQLMADLWIQRGNYSDASEALALLIEDYKSHSELLAPALVKQAQVKNHLKEWDKAIESADKVLAIKDVQAGLRSEAYTEKVKAQLEIGLKASAIETLQAQLEEFEGESPTEYIRYKLGELLFEEGDLTGAENVWSPLRESGSSVLWKIADEKLKSAQFQKNYSRYIDRIPAMSSSGGSVENSQ